MATAKEYQDQIAGYDHPGLFRLWESVLAGDTPGWDSGKAFEYLILRAFQLEGAEVVWPYSVREESGEELEQLDGALFVKAFHCLVETKDYQGVPVDIKPIAKLRNQLLRRPANALGLFFSRSGYTSPARTLARYLAPQTILLWHSSEVGFSLRERKLVDSLVRKYRYTVMHGWPDFNLYPLEE